MTVLGWIFGGLAAVVHVAIFVMESLLFSSPAVQKNFRQESAQLPAVRPWAFNQGFYNLFLAVGAAVGVLLWTAGQATVGRTLLVFCCSSMALAGVVLLASDRRMLRGALVQIVPATVAVVVTLAA